MDAPKTPTTGRRYAGKSLEQRRAARRSSLIAAGKAVFGAKGFHAATVRDVCTAAQLTERYFYESFESREALFAAVYDDLIDQVRDHVVAAMRRQVETDSADMAAMVRAGLRAYFGLIREDPQAGRITLVEVFNASPQPERLSRRMGRLAQELILPLAQGRSGADVGLLTAGALGAVVFIAMRWTLGGYRETEQQVTDSALAMLMPIIFERKSHARS